MLVRVVSSTKIISHQKARPKNARRQSANVQETNIQEVNIQEANERTKEYHESIS